MKQKDVLIIGAGIAGCATALALARRGLSVTILTSPLDQRTYHSSFLKVETLEDTLRKLKEHYHQEGCSRALEHLINSARNSVDELLGAHLSIDRYGNADIHRSLHDQLKEYPQVEWMNHHSAIELLTLETHSEKKSDIFKKSACLGAHVYDFETKQVIKVLAKETVLATGGASSLYPYSAQASTASGTGLAMASEAGARLLNVDRIQFHPVALYSPGKPCIPLPSEFVQKGILRGVNKNFFEPIEGGQSLSLRLYQEQVNHQAANLWLDLTQTDVMLAKEEFPSVDAYCLKDGVNFAKDPIPVVSAALFTCGGVAVDKVGQTTLSRLRAIGEVSCTGLFYEYRDEAMSVLESLAWSVSCAEDIAKQIPKFAYYFPELKEWSYPIDNNSRVISEDWRMLQQIMWHYLGMVRSSERSKRGRDLLQNLKAYNEKDANNTFSIERHHLNQAIQTALLIARE